MTNGKGGKILAFLGLLIGASGLGVAGYAYFTFSGQISDLENQIDNLEEDLDNFSDNATIVNNITNITQINQTGGGLLQTVQHTTDNTREIDETHTLFEGLPGMNLQITTSGESYLYIRFFTTFYMRVFADVAKVQFNVSLRFEQVPVRYTLLTYSQEPAVETSVGVMFGVYMEYITDELAAGTYEADVIWACEYCNTPSSGATLIASSTQAPQERTLVIQEFTA